MKPSTIDRVLQEKNIPSFEFESDKYMVAWWMVIGFDQILAKRTIEYEDGYAVENYYHAPYAKVEACEELYWAVIDNLVECYGEDLYYGVAEGPNLFDDVASITDDGLLNILGLFGKTYGDFLCDLFYAYAAFVEEGGPCEVDDDLEEEDPDSNIEWHLTKKVLRHCKGATLTLAYPDDSVVYWEFVNADNKLWYHRADLDYAEDDSVECVEEYNYFDIDDPDYWGALRDTILSLFANGDVEQCIEIGDPFGLIGINPDDLEDDD